MEGLIFRRIKKTDYLDLTNFLCENWELKKNLSTKLANLVSRICLHIYLSDQNYNRIAVRDGLPIGIIMGRVGKLSIGTYKHILISLLFSFILFFSKEGRAALKWLKDFYNIEELLLSKFYKKYDAELSLFLVDYSNRHLGIGRKLYHRFYSHIISMPVKNFYLLTNNSCRYGFYHYLGMKRVSEKCWYPKYDKKNPVNFYVYVRENLNL